MKYLATISLCDHDFAGGYEHYSFTFSALANGAKSYAVMNRINHDIPYPSMFLNKSQVVALRDWCNSLIVSEV